MKFAMTPPEVRIPKLPAPVADEVAQPAQHLLLDERRRPGPACQMSMPCWATWARISPATEASSGGGVK